MLADGAGGCIIPPMPLPTRIRTWQFKENQVVSGIDNLDAYRKLMYALINSLLTFGTQPWTCLGSSNSTTAAIDGTNRIASATNIVWGTPAQVKSWIILKQTGLATNAQLLIFCQTGGSSSAYYQAYFVFSPNAGFTGGTTIARPTATDELVMTGGSSWNFNVTGAFTMILHVFQTTDGKSTRVFFHRSGYPVTTMLFEKLQSPSAGWTYPIYVALNVASSLTAPGSPSYVNFSRGNGSGFLYHAGSNNAYLTTSGYGSSAPFGVGEKLTDRANTFTGEWPIDPMGVVCDAPLCYGRLGYIADLYWGTGNNSEGYTYKDPSNADSRDWIQIGQMVTPWVGGTAANSVPVIL